MKDWPAISAAIGAATQQPCELIDHETVGGGYARQAEQTMQNLLAAAGRTAA